MLGKFKRKKPENNAIEKRFFEGTNVECGDENIGAMIQDWSCSALTFEEFLKKAGFQMPVTLCLSNGKIMVNMTTEIELVKPSRGLVSCHSYHILFKDAMQTRDYSVTHAGNEKSLIEEIFIQKNAETELKFFYPTYENSHISYDDLYRIQHGNIRCSISVDCKNELKIEHYPELDKELLVLGKTELEIYKILLKFYPEIKKNIVKIETLIEVESGSASFNYLNLKSGVQFLDGKALEIDKNTDEILCHVRADKTEYRYETKGTKVELKNGTLEVKIEDFSNNSSAYEEAMAYIESLRKEALNMNV